jgi:hypothetical protein
MLLEFPNLPRWTRSPAYWHRQSLPAGVRIDDQDRDMAEQLVWNIGANGHVVNVVVGQALQLRLARLIMLVRCDQVVRHANGDLLDCRRANLIVERA